MNIMIPIYTFTIDCLPPSVNHIWRTSWKYGRPIFYKDKKAKEFEEITGQQLKKIRNPIEEEIKLEMVFIFKSEKRFAQRDLDNLLKLICDALTVNSIIKDDSQIIEILCKKQTGDQDSSIGKIYKY